MRMWGVDPKIFCRQHLLGEHVELHMLIGSVKKGRSIDWMLRKGLLDPAIVRERHDLIVEEMKSRGYNHKSPIDTEICEQIKQNYKIGEWDIEANLYDLVSRCSACAERYRDA